MLMKFRNMITVNATQRVLRARVASLRAIFVETTEIKASSVKPIRVIGMLTKIRINRLDVSSLL